MFTSLRRLFSTHEAASYLAARVALSALVAYLAALIVHADETAWPVMSAIIVSRPGQQGPGGTALDRLLGTLAGGGVGLVAGLARGGGAPDYVLLPLMIAPLAFLSADRAAFRAAPIAALIVLSAAEAGSSRGFGAALLRVGDVGLGTISALAVTQLVLRTGPVRTLKRDAAKLVTSLGKLHALAWDRSSEARDKFDRLNGRTRRALRDIGQLARSVRARGEKADPAAGPANRLVTAMSRTHASITFIARALAAAPPSDAVDRAAAPFRTAARARFDALARTLTEGMPFSSTADLANTVAAASASIDAIAHNDRASHIDALPFLLESLKDDLGSLGEAVVSLARSGPA